MRKTAIIIGAAALVAASGTTSAMAAGGGQERQLEAAYTQAHRSQAAVSESAAKATARARHSGGVVDAHLQNEGTLVWEFVIERHGYRWEVQVDAASGHVVSDQPDE